MGIYSVKPAFQRTLQPLSNRLVGAGVSPDVLTFAAVVISGAGATALVLGEGMSWLWLLIPVAAIARITLNALDGMVAVGSGRSRPFGEVLNELSDRVSDALWFSGLAFVVDPVLALGVLSLVLVGSMVGVAAKAAGGRRVYAGVMGKADRMIVVSLTGPAAYFGGVRAFTWACWLMGVGSAITIIQRLWITRRELSQRA